MMDDKSFMACQRTGLDVIQAEYYLAYLPDILQSDQSHIIIAAVNWGKFLKGYNLAENYSLFDEQIVLSDNRLKRGEVHPKNSSDVATVNSNVITISSQHACMAYINEVLREVLGYGAKHKIDQEAGFIDLGVDSLMIISFSEKISQDLGLPITSSHIFNYPSIRRLSEYVYAQLDYVYATRQEQSNTFDGDLLDKINQVLT